MGFMTCASHAFVFSGIRYRRIEAHASFVFPSCPPQGGYKDKKTHFIEGGDAGARGDKINAFIKAVL
jgi:hypothetical protein